MTDYSDHAEVKQLLKDDQHAEHDLREQVGEVMNFLHHPQGQWEDRIWQDYEGRPRYTFDQMKPAIAKIWAEMAANEYVATTAPVGGNASKEVSKVLDGLIRNIQNISSFDDISTRAGKQMIASGFSGWRIVAKHVEESFNQDLVIIPLHDIHERVWFDANSEMQTREDAMHVNVVVAMGKSQAEAKWPHRKGVFENVDTDRQGESYSYKPLDKVHIAEILYKKPVKKTVYLLEDDTVVDEAGLKRKGLKASDAKDKRDLKTFQVISRKYDGKDWLEDEKETVFSMLPVIPVYANFDVVESKVTFEGVVRPLMDHQRVFNYVESRKVEESILAPRQTTWVDDRIAEGRTDELSELNRNPASVQLYKGGISDAQLPFITPGPQPNPALSEISNDMIRDISLSTGMMNPIQEGNNAKRDSDFRFDQRNSMGQMGTFEYYRGQKVALEHTNKVLLDGAPKVYDSERKIEIMDQSGQTSEVAINEKNIATGEVLNDLTVGKYNITMEIGPSMESRQTEANTRLIEMGDRVPGILERNTDILANNIAAPGMDAVSERERKFLFAQGLIPEEQWTEEEREENAQAQQQAQEPDAATLIAQAEMQKAANQAQEAQFRALEAQARLELQQTKQQTDTTLEGMKMQLEQEKALRQAQTQDIEDLKTLVDTIKSYKEATGADIIAGPHLAEGIINQATMATEKQEQIAEIVTSAPAN